MGLPIGKTKLIVRTLVDSLGLEGSGACEERIHQLGHLMAQFWLQAIKPTVDPFEDNRIGTQRFVCCFYFISFCRAFWL